MPESSQSFRKFKKTPLILSVVFLALSCFVFVFLYQVTMNNQKVYETRQTEWQNETSRREEVKMLERSIQEIKSERTLLESHFAYGSNVVPFLDTLERLSRQAGAASEEIVSVDLPKDENVLAVAMKTEGSFEALYKFMILLENSPYELEFLSVDMKRQTAQASSDAATGSPQWEMMLGIKLLSFAP